MLRRGFGKEKRIVLEDGGSTGTLHYSHNTARVPKVVKYKIIKRLGTQRRLIQNFQ